MLPTIRYTSIITAVVALTACGQAKTDKPVESTTAAGTTMSPSGVAAAADGKSMVRFVNTLQAPKNLDMKVNDRVLFENIAPKAVTPYAEVQTNSPTFTVRLAGKDSALAENKESVADGKRYTAVALPKADGKSELKIWRDDLMPDSGKARIRVIHAAPGMDDVKIGVAGEKDPMFKSINFGAEAGFKDVMPADLLLVIGRDAKGAIPIKLKSMHLVAGHAYSIVLITKKGNLDVITFVDEGMGTKP